MEIVIVGLAAAVGAAVLALAVPWVWGFGRALLQPDPLIQRARRPTIRVLRFTTDVSPGATAEVHVRCDGADRCWIRWAGSTSRQEMPRLDRPGEVAQEVSRTGEVYWTCRISKQAKPGLWPITVTAEGPRGRSSAVLPMRIVTTNGAGPVSRVYVGPEATRDPYGSPRSDTIRPSPWQAPISADEAAGYAAARRAQTTDGQRPPKHRVTSGRRRQRSPQPVVERIRNGASQADSRSRSADA